jgi:hypothetical protein
VSSKQEIGQLIRAKISDDIIHEADERLLIVAIRILDNLVDLQSRDFISSSTGLAKRRALGISLINFDKIIKNSSPSELHELVEKTQFHLIKASMELAKEKGRCEGFSQTSYSKGVMPDRRLTKKMLTQIGGKNTLGWEGLSLNVQKYGMRNSTLTAGVDRFESYKSANEELLLKASIVQKYFDNNVVVYFNTSDVLRDHGRLLVKAYTMGIRAIRLAKD